MGTVHGLVNDCEHLGGELLTEARLPFVVPVVTALEILEGLGDPAGCSCYGPKRWRT